MNKSDVLIRLANIGDIGSITEIYNEAVLNGVATFDTQEKTVEDRIAWFNSRRPIHPVLVAQLNDEVIGWASLNQWSDRSAYDGTAEVSIYMHHAYRDQGVGGILFKELIEQARTLNLHYLLSRITEGNEKSIALHLKNGFSIVGVMHEVGNKFGRYLDVTIMEKIIK
jgi:phosphinothricin acetyltransferase